MVVYAIIAPMLQAAAETAKKAATTPGLSEWLKALISSIVGLVVGILASPLTLWAKTRLDRRSAKEALYSDLGRMYHVLNRAVDIYPEAAAPNTDEARTNQRRAIDVIKNNINDAVFQYYSTSGAASFWGLPEAVAIKKLYQVIVATGRDLNVGQWPDTLAAIEATFRQFNLFFDERRIDEARLMKYRGEHRATTGVAVTRYHSAGKKGPLIRDSQGSPRSRWTSAD
jgi:hypothetical protein